MHTTTNLEDLLKVFAHYMDIGLQLLMGLAVLSFVWYIVKFFIRPSSDERKEAKQYVMWSILGFFIIISFWSFVRILGSSLGLNNNTATPWSEISNNLFPR